MPDFPLKASTLLVLLAVGTGCGARSQISPSPSEPPPLTPVPVAASPKPVLNNAFDEAMDAAMGAAIVAQSAVSPDDWRVVARQWQRAIALLSSLPASHPRKALAAQKIAEYQYNLTVAQHRAIGKAVPPPRNAKQVARATSGFNFLVFAGGGAPSYNEIALEKNVLYFQRTLAHLGYNPDRASIFFANGNDGQATIRYLDEANQERFKVPNIPNLKGAATLENFQNWIAGVVSRRDRRPIFFYFTGHGLKNEENTDNNSLILWNEQNLSVRDFVGQLERLPQDTPVTTMMAQCYSGGFANFIYEQGDPNLSVALQTRCGFFATLKTLPSVGCTPEVNEADYRDYSSSFFAGLSGVSRTGEVVPSADYNKDGKVSYAEAHSFAKIDEQTSDLPVSTSEVWLQRQASEEQKAQILQKPIAQILKTARPEQQYVVNALLQKFGFDRDNSYPSNLQKTSDRALSEVETAYLTRLRMELTNIAIEQQIRASRDREAIAILDRLIECEGGFWQST